MGLLGDLWGVSAEDVRQKRHRVKKESLIPDTSTGGLLDSAALFTAPVPVLGDVLGVAADAYRFATKPESRSPLNVGLSLLGAAPFVPGLLGTFAGVGAKTADVLKLDAAKKMVKAGADPVDVWKTTGWTDQFPDGKWRFEIPDKKAKLTNFAQRYEQTTADMSHPELFAAYPDVEKLKGTIAFGRGTPSEGMMREADYYAGGPTPRAAKSVALHELQHGVQQSEGFAKGGAVEWNASTRSYWPPFTPSDDVLSAAEKLAEMKRVHKLSPQETAKKYRAAFKIDDDLMASAIDMVESGALPKWQKELSKYRVGPYDAYRALAGEAEARLTQSRMPLTAAERALRPPWLEFDVPREQQIVRW